MIPEPIEAIVAFLVFVTVWSFLLLLSAVAVAMVWYGVLRTREER